VELERLVSWTPESQPEPMHEPSLPSLVRSLDRALREPDRTAGAQVAGMLAAYAADCHDWRDYVRFREDCYARNLVSASGLFELLVICWQPGQVSPIHDHQGQRCWMAVLDGGMRETQFKESTGGPLREHRSTTFHSGQVAYIQDEIALHEIAPAGEAAGVTLHLYSRPIRECRIFDRATGQVSVRGLAYHSVEGVLGA
jgi:cysteine dioxygenase